MSEAELHFIRARLRGGQLSKARRGELPVPLPVGGVGGERLLVRLELLPGDCKHANNPAAGAQLVLGAKDEVLYISSGLASRIERGVVDFDTGEGFHGLIAFDIVPESEIPLEAQFR